MKFLLVPDSFKGSLSSRQVAEAMRTGIAEENEAHATSIYPIADGGEGSLECINAAADGAFVATKGVDALGRDEEASYLRVGEKAFVELACTAGLTSLADAERNPAITSTYGTGLQLKHALEQGATELVLCIGGSSTNDAGLGIASALGVTFLDRDMVSFVPTGDSLNRVKYIGSASLPDGVQLSVLCDVNNPMVGPEGATYTYATQKGASQSDLVRLEENMVHLLRIFDEHSLPDVSTMPGAGAAGGVGGGLHALFGAELISGIDYFIASLGLQQQLADCDLVLTGEGKLDRQTMHGKTIKGLIQAASQHQKRVIAICGQVDLTPSEIRDLGLAAAFAIKQEGMTLADAVSQASQLISAKTAEVTKKLSIESSK